MIPVPERNTIGKSAKSVFFEDVNDIDIYIEDTGFGYEKLLSTIFSRVFEGQYRIEKVFPLGARDIVVNQHGIQLENIIRPSLFVIDGDLTAVPLTFIAKPTDYQVLDRF